MPNDWTLLRTVTESESYVTTDSQSASVSWNKAPIRGLRPDFYCRRTVAGLFMWGALSDERTGLSFTIAAGPSQRSHSLVRAPLDSRPYFTVSDLRLPISSPPTTRRVTVEVFDPASTRVSPPHFCRNPCLKTYLVGPDTEHLASSNNDWVWVWVLCYDRRSVGQSVLV
jgi:hypothetical protein